MAAERNVVNMLDPVRSNMTELNTMLTDKLSHPLNRSHSRHYISRSTGCLYGARDEDKRLAPSMRGQSVEYKPAPDIKLNDCMLRVPPSPWNKGGCHGQQISQWKSDPHIAATSGGGGAGDEMETLEQWEIEVVARRVNSQHCYLHLFLKVNGTVWDDIKMKYENFSERMLQLLLAWKQQNGGRADRQQLVRALNSSHLNELADQVKEKNYVSNSHSKHPPLGHTTSNKYPITSTGVDQQYSYQDEKRRSSVPVLQRQMTQNTLRSLLQLRRGTTINE